MNSCPYCGFDDQLVIGRDNRLYFVRCPECGMSGPLQDTSDEAIESWDITAGNIDIRDEYHITGFPINVNENNSIHVRTMRLRFNGQIDIDEPTMKKYMKMLSDMMFDELEVDIRVCER